ncbi:hypothetical protein SERLADRAFT_442940 [Serpula lacrymans var. lacrymans S7.9]|nr:uncharacterized protein SERLADRAFT_442940 [Serpula lacrymans var. lacrymans S7.9]EGO19464.1 hypothetical protein SERLADRAFT_442940 [Serpula lacrymans var. lacrymans S7.9]
MTRKIKVAVVGSGLAGLTAAYLLTQKPSSESESELPTVTEFEVHVFEKAKVLGMDSSSISVPITKDRKSDWRIDVPMRSFQGGYYPQLLALYKHLGVKFRQANFSYSFSLLSSFNTLKAPKMTTTMIYNGQSGRAGVSMPSSLTVANSKSLPTQVTNYTVSYGLFVISTIYLLLNYLRLIMLSIPCLRSARAPEMTFREWIEYAAPIGFIGQILGSEASWKDFSYDVLVPLFSAVCTAPEEDVTEHPAEEFLDYVWLTLFTHHYVVTNGVKDVVKRLSKNVQHVHVGTSISAIRPHSEDPHLVSIHCSINGREEVYSDFRHIVFATQANSAIPLLTSYMKSLSPESSHRPAIEEQIRCLKKFHYRPSIVINHTDDQLIPDNINDRRDLNLVSVASGKVPVDLDDSPHCLPASYTMATHILSPPEEYLSHLPTIYQTTNPIVAPREECILSEARLERAVLTMDAKAVLRGFCLQDAPRWWQCAVQCDSRLGPLQGGGATAAGLGGGPGIWLCGSYAYYGIPLLEGCVVSARNVVEQGILASEGIPIGHGLW